MHKHCAVAVAALLVVCAASQARAANDAAAGYETIKSSLVKVWAFDKSGHPSQSGTGIIVDADAHRAVVLTATHVIDGAALVRIDVSRDVHDLVAHVERTGPRDLTLLSIARGGLRAARFAPRSHAVVEGNLVAVAGYVKNDELIGIVGQEPRVLFPGTVSSRPDDGRYLELENVHIEEGLSGGAVFDPGTGDVLGVVTSRTADRRGGFADSGTLVVLPFLAANHVASAQPAGLPPAAASPGLPPTVLPSVALRPAPTATLHAVVALSPRPVSTAIVSWQGSAVEPKHFAAVHSGCRIAITVDVQTLQFIISHDALVSPHHRGELLGISLQRRVGPRCINVDDSDPTPGNYEPVAMEYNGHHVTMRFSYKGDDTTLFPSEASLDADLDGASATATVSFFDRDWNGSISVPLTATILTSVSGTW